MPTTVVYRDMPVVSKEIQTGQRGDAHRAVGTPRVFSDDKMLGEREVHSFPPVEKLDVSGDSARMSVDDPTFLHALACRR
jgi:hypothetical protein